MSKKQIALEKLIDTLAIEAGKKHAAIYDIHYRRAGWGFKLHYDDKYIHHYEMKTLDAGEGKHPIIIWSETNMSDGMAVQSYYPTLRKAAQETLKYIQSYKVNEGNLKTIRA
jgi:hypothetical protein